MTQTPQHPDTAALLGAIQRLGAKDAGVPVLIAADLERTGRSDIARTIRSAANQGQQVLATDNDDREYDDE